MQSNSSESEEEKDDSNSYRGREDNRRVGRGRGRGYRGRGRGIEIENGVEEREREIEIEIEREGEGEGGRGRGGERGRGRGRGGGEERGRGRGRGGGRRGEGGGRRGGRKEEGGGRREEEGGRREEGRGEREKKQPNNVGINTFHGQGMIFPPPYQTGGWANNFETNLMNCNILPTPNQPHLFPFQYPFPGYQSPLGNPYNNYTPELASNNRQQTQYGSRNEKDRKNDKFYKNENPYNNYKPEVPSNNGAQTQYYSRNEKDRKNDKFNENEEGKVGQRVLKNERIRNNNGYNDVDRRIKRETREKRESKEENGNTSQEEESKCEEECKEGINKIETSENVAEFEYVYQKADFPSLQIELIKDKDLQKSNNTESENQEEILSVDENKSIISSSAASYSKSSISDVADIDDLIDINDEGMKIPPQYIVIFEFIRSDPKHFSALPLKGKGVFVIRNDDRFYFKSKESKNPSYPSILQTNNNFSDFIKNMHINETIFEDLPIFSINTILNDSEFKLIFKEFRKKFRQRIEIIFYIAPSKYNKILKTLSRNSPNIKKYENFHKANNSLKIILYGKNANDEMYKRAENYFISECNYFFRKNQPIYFQINFPKISRKSEEFKIIIEIFIRKNGGQFFYDDADVKGLRSCILFSQRNSNSSLKDFIKNHFKTIYKNFKNIFITQIILTQNDWKIFELFLKEVYLKKFERQKIPVEINQEKNTITLLKSAPTLKNEIEQKIKNYEFMEKSLSFELRLVNNNIKIDNDFEKEYVYKEALKILPEFNPKIEEKIAKIVNNNSGLKIFLMDKNFTREKQFSSSFKMNLLIYYNKTEIKKDSGLEEYLNKIGNLLNDYIITMFKVDRITSENLQNLNIKSFKINTFPNVVFCLGKGESLLAIQQNSQVKIAEPAIKNITIKQFEKSSDEDLILKNRNSLVLFKNMLKVSKILDPITEKLSYKDETLSIKTNKTDIVSISQRICESLENFKIKNLETETMESLTKNQITYLVENFESIDELKSKFDVSIDLRNIFPEQELQYEDKSIKLIEGKIEDSPCSNDIFILCDENFVDLKFLKSRKNILKAKLFDQNQNWALFEQSIQKAVEMSEKNKFSSLALHICGEKIGIDLLLIFKIFLQNIQEQFFKKKTCLKEILIYVENKLELNSLCSFLKKAVAEREFSGLAQKSSIQWFWKNNHAVERYDQEIEKNLNKGYQKYLQDNLNSKITIEFDIHRNPGTHAFDLENNIVIYKVLGTQEKLTFNKVWLHDNVAFNDSISTYLTQKLKEGTKNFSLFLNSYIIDFSQMQQINQQTGYIRKIQKIEDEDDDSSPVIFKMLNYKLCISPQYGFVTIKNFHGENRHLIVKGAIQFILDKYFQKYAYNLPKNLEENKIKALQKICETEKIDVVGELKSEEKIMLIGTKQAIEKFIEESKKFYFLWDENGLELFELNSSDEEYKFVEKLFMKTMVNRKIISIKRNQNKELYLSYQESVQSLKERKKRLRIVESQSETMERYLWHGTSSIDPMELIQGLNTISTQFANDHCMWGRGLYFAVNASYSDSYAFQSKSDGTKKFLLCLVYTGDFIKLPADRSLRQPPNRNDGAKLPYDSIQGNTQGSDIFVLYKDHRNYPHYLVEFK